MDWIEEKYDAYMEQIRNATLKKSLFYTITLCLIAAVVMYIVIGNICSGWILAMQERHPILKELTIFWEAAYFASISFGTKVIYIFLNLVNQYGLIACILVSEYIGLTLFFKQQINPGIEAVCQNITYMKLGDFGHEQMHYSTNEIGQISDGVEALRRQLIQMKQNEWNLQSKQREINAAFAHDIRTPLTVMKGYTEFLLKYQPMGKVSQESLMEKLEIMSKQQDRLLSFSKTMTQIQDIDMRELRCRSVAASDIILRIKNTADAIQQQGALGRESMPKDIQGLGSQPREIIDQMNSEAMDSDLELVLIYDAQQTDWENRLLTIDEDLMMEVCENLISNALRYARTKIEIMVEFRKNSLIVYIKDDGKGYSVAALKEAKNLYWSEEKEKTSHFGMGLYMCEQLCRKHGGRLNITNAVEGGAIAAAEFQIG